jgi:hypothetical protein
MVRNKTIEVKLSSRKVYIREMKAEKDREIADLKARLAELEKRVK